MRQRWILPVLALVLALAGAAAAWGQDAAELRIQGLDVGGFPDVTFKTTVPPSLLAAEGDVAFSIEENGRRVDDVRVEHVTGDAAPPSVVLVMDTSGSMRGAPMTDAIAAARSFVDSLGDGARIAFVTFSDTVQVRSPSGTDRGSLLEHIEGVDARGETALYDAVARAVTLVPAQSEGQRAIVVLSDGGDTVSDTDFDTVVRAVASAGVPVYAVALKSDEYNPRALETIAGSSGGRLIPVAASAELAENFQVIAEEIRDAYVVSYTSTRPGTKDIELDIAASNGGVEALASTVYANPMFTWDPDAGDVTMEVAAPNAGVLAGAIMLAFGSAALFIFGILALVTRERSRLADLRFYDQLHDIDDAAHTISGDAVRDKVVDAVAAIAAKRGFMEVMGTKLEQAGFPLRVAEYMTAHVFSVALLGVVTQLLLGSFLTSVLVVVIAAFGPVLMLDVAADRRRARFEAQLPDVLSMMASSLRGGWGLLQAIEFVVSQAGEPVSSEFRRVQTEARLGMSLEDALHKMGDRVGSADFDAAVSAIVIQREVGGNLAEVLDIVAKTVRDRSALERQVKALTAEGRLSAYILIALPFFEALMLSIVNPGYMVPLLTTVPGLVMTIGSLALLVLGSIWLRAITRIEV